MPGTKAEEMGKPSNGNNSRNLAVAVVSAILGATGGPFVLVKFGVNPYRTDPATGTEIRLLDARVTAVENHVGSEHPDRLGDYESRITSNTIQIATMATHLTSIDSRVIGMDRKLDRLLER